MFHRILVPLDGSLIAENAIEPAFALARAGRGSVIFVRAPRVEALFVPMAGTTGVLWPDQSLKFSEHQARQYLAALEKTWAGTDVPLRALLVEGDAGSVILDTAAAEGADLICMSTHGHSGFTRWMLGSTTEKVLRAAQCPVLVLRSRQPLRRVLITLDGSPLAEAAVAPALALAQAMAAEVTLLRVVDDPHASAAEGAALAEQAAAYLADMARRKAPAGMALHHQVARGPAAEAILNYAAAQASDVIAMATHGRAGLRRWVYGSITEKVMRTAHCAMLTVRPPAHDLR